MKLAEILKYTLNYQWGREKNFKSQFGGKYQLFNDSQSHSPLEMNNTITQDPSGRCHCLHCLAMDVAIVCTAWQQ